MAFAYVKKVALRLQETASDELARGIDRTLEMLNKISAGFFFFRVLDVELHWTNLEPH